MSYAQKWNVPRTTRAGLGEFPKAGRLGGVRPASVVRWRRLHLGRGARRNLSAPRPKRLARRGELAVRRGAPPDPSPPLQRWVARRGELALRRGAPPDLSPPLQRWVVRRGQPADEPRSAARDGRGARRRAAQSGPRLGRGECRRLDVARPRRRPLHDVPLVRAAAFAAALFDVWIRFPGRSPGPDWTARLRAPCSAAPDGSGSDPLSHR